MFALPNLPTDSLYKFIFITGLISVFYSSYLSRRNQDYDNKLAVSIDSLTFLMGQQMISTKADLMQSKNNTERTLDRLDYLKTIDKSRLDSFQGKHFDEEIDEAGKIIDKSTVISDSVQKILNHYSAESNLADMKYKITKSNRNKNQTEVDNYFKYGIMMIVLGFFFWFYRIQIPQDELQNVQLELAKMELAKKQTILSRVQIPCVEDNNNPNNTVTND